MRPIGTEIANGIAGSGRNSRAIRAKAAAGSGDALPSTRLLATSLQVARGTVVDAYAQLIAEGFLESRGGAGT
ncbi:GntR family transcriptional regulator, partial [Burkholderia cepacia]|uniref:GntR family transcriptional regulator n=1 Tax=Burkholderia cepacia TaxID=292 RepID=UPI00299F6C90